MKIYRHKKTHKLYVIYESNLGLGSCYTAEAYPLSNEVLSGVKLKDFEVVGER